MTNHTELLAPLDKALPATDTTNDEYVLVKRTDCLADLNLRASAAIAIRDLTRQLEAASLSNLTQED